MALTYGKLVVIGPTAGGTPTGTFIMLHGLGDTGDGWSDVAGQFSAALPTVKFMFPTAPHRKITLNMGMRMNGWYDIKSLEDIDQSEDEAGLMESKRYVEELLAAEVAAGVPSAKIVVGGFSQGGAVAMLMMRSEVKLAGVIGLSAYLPLRKSPPVVSDANKATPLLMAHGEADVVVAFHFGKDSAAQMKGCGVETQFLAIPGMGHSACPTELQAVAKFLAAHLK
ncbi:hypothetical protein FOA52_005158 [Chlamydomonas sp. UWO 241]|nr:hypothetical protein FOA52_005158 [Chlamydomonas sp. UWO 241]